MTNSLYERGKEQFLEEVVKRGEKRVLWNIMNCHNNTEKVRDDKFII